LVCSLFLFCFCLLFSLLFFARSVPAADPLQVRVEGVEGKLLENVQKVLALPPGLIHDGQVDQRWLDWFQRRIPKRVLEAAQPFGFYHAEVEVDQQTRPEGGILLVVLVKPGDPVRLDRVDVVLEGPGASHSALEEKIRKFPLQKGDGLRQDLYEEGKSGLKAEAIDRGYLQAEFSRHEIRLWPGENRAEIQLVLETGPRYRFGKTIFTGAEDYPEKFLRRYLAYRAGKIFSYRKLGLTQQNFLDSDRFRNVTLTPLIEQAEEDRVPVQVELDPSARYRLRPGIGYGTDTGARFSLEYRDVNLWHLGNQWVIEGVIAERRQFLENRFIFPGKRNIDTYSVLRAAWEKEDPKVFKSQKVFVEYERLRGFRHGIKGSVFLRLLDEKFEVGDEGKGHTRLLIPGCRLVWRKLDNPARPRRGFQLSAEVRGTHEALLSDQSLMQVIGGGDFLLPLPFRLALTIRAEGGTTFYKNRSFRDLPPSLRFFAGGDQSIRGFAYQSVGPEDDDGDVKGGSHLLAGGVELERAISENWGVATFFDAGDAYDKVTNFHLNSSVGIGVRRYTAVGPLRVDLAYRLTGRQGHGVRLHVGLGVGW